VSRRARPSSIPARRSAVEKVREVDGFATVVDMMINSRYHVEHDEVAALRTARITAGGGPQGHPFLLYRATWHHRPSGSSLARRVRVLKQWLNDLGHPVPAPSSVHVGRTDSLRRKSPI
jgi:hypothetical protein